MIEKDYLTRLIKIFFDAINKIVNSIDREDIEGAKIQIADSYKLLGSDKDYFLNTDCDELFSFFRSKEGNYLERVKLLGELIFLDAQTEDNHKIKGKKLEKAEILFEHYLKFSKDYDFRIKNKLVLIRNQNESIF